jgi:predicted enzyme involved in methoxymalonyl-ACP biosynthesis
MGVHPHAEGAGSLKGLKRFQNSRKWCIRVRDPNVDDDGIDLLALDDRVAQDGLKRWQDPLFWHQAKQEISSAASPLYGDLVARLLAAKRGRSAKCLILDLDNTLWGA